MLVTIVSNFLQLLILGTLGLILRTHPEVMENRRGNVVACFVAVSLAVFGLASYGAYRLNKITEDMLGSVTGGDSFACLMLYEFSASMRIGDLDKIGPDGNPVWNEYSRDLGEIDAPAVMLPINWKLTPSVYWRIFFAARNGQ